ncbi:MAG TPA: hypothetical protein VD816_01155, partial [Ohtaekwangia sp.]|nr:hypothetical protein [Ohtaekwangia sp.]
MKVCAVWVALFLSLSIPAFSQVLGDYRSNQSGNWNVPATWQRFNGITWVAATATPTNLSGSITIQSAHEVTVPAGLTLTADQLTVDGVLTIASGGQLNIANGAGTDLTAVSASSLVSVSGTLQINNGAILDNQSIITSVVFQSGSVYRHSYTTSFGDLPAATWDPNSTVSV